MSINNCNIAQYTRAFAVSAAKFTDVRELIKWASEANLPNTYQVDFIGPQTLHNMAATALNLGQSFVKPGKVLFINMDDSPMTGTFIARVKEYQASFMQYDEVVLGEDNLFHPVQDRSVNISYYDDREVEEQGPAWNDPLKPMTWNEAKQCLFKFGGPVRRLSWCPHSFVGYNKGKELEAEKFWVEANKKAAIRNGGSMMVQGYYTHCDGEVVDMAWKPTMADELAEDWVLADKHLTLMDIERTPSNRYKLTYMLQPGEINTSGSVLFTLYDMLYGKKRSEVMVVTGMYACGELILSVMQDMKVKLYNPKAEVVANTLIDERERRKPDPVVNFLGDVYVAESTEVRSEKGDPWGKEQLLENIKMELIRNPALSVVIDLKGFAEDPIVIDVVGQEKTNELGVELCNYMRSELGAFCKVQGNNWAIVDIDYEASDKEAE